MNGNQGFSKFFKIFDKNSICDCVEKKRRVYKVYIYGIYGSRSGMNIAFNEIKTFPMISNVKIDPNVRNISNCRIYLRHLPRSNKKKKITSISRYLIFFKEYIRKFNSLSFSILFLTTYHIFSNLLAKFKKRNFDDDGRHRDPLRKNGGGFDMVVRDHNRSVGNTFVTVSTYAMYTPRLVLNRTWKGTRVAAAFVHSLWNQRAEDLLVHRRLNADRLNTDFSMSRHALHEPARIKGWAFAFLYLRLPPPPFSSPFN